MPSVSLVVAVFTKQHMHGHGLASPIHVAGEVDPFQERWRSVADQKARYGWESDFPEFSSASPTIIREKLESFVVDASPEQVRAWRECIPPLQGEVQEVLLRDSLARSYSAILEYELPMESRRPDVVLLAGHGVLVLELKGKLEPSQADLDQAAAYARGLRCYHRECWDRVGRDDGVPCRVRIRPAVTVVAPASNRPWPVAHRPSPIAHRPSPRLN